MNACLAIRSSLILLFDGEIRRKFQITHRPLPSVLQNNQEFEMSKALPRIPWSRPMMFALAVPCILFAALPESPQAKLKIVNAGVQRVEDGPFVPRDYKFLPGDYLHFEFAVSGFKISGDAYSESRQISLSYTVEAVDDKNIALAPPVRGTIKDDITPEDKKWIPKRRASFLLPSYIADGTYTVRVTVEDVLAKTKANADYPFQIGGRIIHPVTSLTLQNFRFLRSEQDGPALELPAYRAGATVWARFDITGFKVGPANSVALQYGVKVLRPDGSEIFAQPEAANEKIATSYPPQFVPGVLSITTTPNLAGGEYTMVVAVHDLIGSQDRVTSYQFRIE
jgi:hypothetical protein